MLFNLLSDLTPGVYPQYDERLTNTIWALIAVIILLSIVTFVFLCLFLYYKFNKYKKNEYNKPLRKNISKEELNLIDNYNKLSETDKKTINQMLSSLNSHNSDKE